MPNVKNRKTSAKEVTGSHGHRPHGKSILWPALYEHLRAKGYSKEKAARISNAAWNKKHHRGYKNLKSTRVTKLIEKYLGTATIDEVPVDRVVGLLRKYGAVSQPESNGGLRRFLSKHRDSKGSTAHHRRGYQPKVTGAMSARMKRKYDSWDYAQRIRQIKDLKHDLMLKDEKGNDEVTGDERAEYLSELLYLKRLTGTQRPGGKKERTPTGRVARNAELGQKKGRKPSTTPEELARLRPNEAAAIAAQRNPGGLAAVTQRNAAMKEQRIAAQRNKRLGGVRTKSPLKDAQAQQIADSIIRGDVSFEDAARAILSGRKSIKAPVDTRPTLPKRVASPSARKELQFVLETWGNNDRFPVARIEGTTVHIVDAKALRQYIMWARELPADNLQYDQGFATANDKRGWRAQLKAYDTLLKDLFS